jgi:hypothetical protein
MKTPGGAEASLLAADVHLRGRQRHCFASCQYGERRWPGAMCMRQDVHETVWIQMGPSVESRAARTQAAARCASRARGARPCLTLADRGAQIKSALVVESKQVADKRMHIAQAVRLLCLKIISVVLLLRGPAPRLCVCAGCRLAGRGEHIHNRVALQSRAAGRDERQAEGTCYYDRRDLHSRRRQWMVRSAHCH